MAYGIFDIRAIFTSRVQVLPADTTTPKTLFTFATTPQLITDILLTNSDTIAHMATLTYYTTGGSSRIGSVEVPARAGYDGAGPVSFAANGGIGSFGGWALTNAHALQIGVTVTMTAGTSLDAIVYSGYL